MRIVPGHHSVFEVLKVRPQCIKELWVREGATKGPLDEFVTIAKQRKISLKRVSQRTLDGQVQSHQGVIAFVEGEPQWPSSSELKSREEALIFALDSLEDPQNVGSLMRSAWNLGAVGVLSSRDRAAGEVPAAEKVAAGGFEHVPFLEVPSLQSELNSLKELGFWVYGTSATSEKVLGEEDIAPKAVIVIGSEESGLRKPVESACDVVLRIPHVAGSSFNAAVAAAIAGYEFRRQRDLSENRKNSREKL